MNIDEFLIQIATNALSWQRQDGSFPPGHNGPYHDPETPVRNTGHWLITMGKCYKLTRDKIFRDAVHKAAAYLVSTEARPKGFSYYHRNGHKNRCNGLIGPAWTIEALVAATEILEDPKYIEIAEDVFLQHPFDDEYGLWRRVEIDGSIQSIDATFNHQLWFAACGSLIHGVRRTQILQKVQGFMDHLTGNLTILEDGLIYHLVESYSNRTLSSPRKRLGIIIRPLIQDVKRFSWPKFESLETILEHRRVYETFRSIGYHAFNMYGFSMLKHEVREHAFWGSERFSMALQYMKSEKYKKGLESNKYGFPYNPPGFEVPIALSVFENAPQDQSTGVTRAWVNEQLRRSYNKKNMTLDLNTEDSQTMTARIYELTRLPNSILTATKIDI